MVMCVIRVSEPALGMEVGHAFCGNPERQIDGGVVVFIVAGTTLVTGLRKSFLHAAPICEFTSSARLWRGFVPVTKRPVRLPVVGPKLA